MIVLDTHAWIWLVDSPARLGVQAATAVRKARRMGEALSVSCISTWELYMLVDRGRLSLAIAPDVWVARCATLSFLRFQPVNNEIARIAVTECADMHGDPADRMIVATARYLGAAIVTCDEKIRSSGLAACLW